jgi:hypothetical protein
MSLATLPLYGGWTTYARVVSTPGSYGYFISVTACRPTAISWLEIQSSSAERSSIRLRPGVAPSSPNDGDIWFDGTDLKMRVGGVTKTFVLAD